MEARSSRVGVADAKKSLSELLGRVAYRGLVRRLVVVSNNIAHFSRIQNLRVVDWMRD